MSSCGSLQNISIRFCAGTASSTARHGSLSSPDSLTTTREAVYWPARSGVKPWRSASPGGMVTADPSGASMSSQRYSMMAAPLSSVPVPSQEAASKGGVTGLGAA